MTDTPKAIAIRDAIYDRLAVTGSEYKTVRKTPVPQLQPSMDKLPALSVFVMNGISVPDGEGNIGPIDFINDDTIGISVVRGYDDEAVLEGTIADEVEAIRAKLFTDAEFTKMGPDALFESIERITRQWVMPQDGETYFVELRLEITFRTRNAYSPVIPDDFKEMRTTYAPVLQADAPDDDKRTTIVRVIDEELDP